MQKVQAQVRDVHRGEAGADLDNGDGTRREHTCCFVTCQTWAK